MGQEGAFPLQLVYCYAHEDVLLRNQLDKHLAMVRKLGWIQRWSDRDISAGADRQQVRDLQFARANLFLLLVSANFIHSDYCYGVEMQQALQRHQAGEAVVIPILLRPVEWEKTPLGALQALPRDGRPVTSWNNRDKAFRQIAREIRVMIEALRRPVVIISSSPQQTFAERLTQHLITSGISLWNNKDTLELTGLQKHIREASAVVILASPETEHAPMLKEARRLSEMYQRPVIGLWISPEEQDSRQPALHGQEWIHVDSGQEERAFQQLRAALRSHSVLLPTYFSRKEQERSLETRNPYKGLRAFTAEDARDFFGRTPLIHTLVTSVKTILENKGHQPARLLTVVGASGSGKSSVVQAGLLPALQAGQVFESNTWAYLDSIVPGTHPLDALALTLFEQFPEKSFKQFREDLDSASTQGLHLYATALARRQGCQHVVLVVDQFEEVFTLTPTEQERQQFLDLLVTACTKPEGPLIVILTLRADFYDRPMHYPALYELIVQHQVPMLPMTLSDLRAVITQPAGLPDVQLTFEGNLVGDMLFDIQGQREALPLLQFTLEQLFERREGYVLTERAYQEMGGIRGALAKHAEETYQALPSQEHRHLTRTLFLRLLDPGAIEQETTRRRARLTEFVFADAEQTRLIQATMNAFVKARLLTTTANEGIGTATIEVSHEALIQEWPRFVNWLREARDDIHLQQSISRDAATWEHCNRSGDRLYRGAALKEAQAWAKRNTVSRQEQAFLRASAAKQVRFLLAVIAVCILTITSSVIAGWVVLSQSKPDYVTRTSDDGIGSLRWAIANAPSGSTITFAPGLIGQTIVLHNTDLHITRPNVIIQGYAAGRITVREIGVSVIVDKPASATISDIIFQGSRTKDQQALIQNAGKLTLKTCLISDNTSTIFGGGIYNNGGTLTVSNTTISGNTASDEGGGIYNFGGTLTVSNTTISGNAASGLIGSGGGIASYGLGSSSVVHVTLVFCTLVNNRQGTSVGSVGFDLVSYQFSTTYMKACIVGENNAQVTPITGEITSGGYNLIQRMSSVRFAKNTAHSTDRSVNGLAQVFGPSPQLAPNGGPTETYQLLSSSDNPAVGIIPQDACTDATGRRVLTDQRGMPRPGKNTSACDSGAYEYQVPS